MDEQYQQLEAGVLPLASLATAVAVLDAEYREIIRIVKTAQRAIAGSYASERLPYLHRIVRNAFPDREFTTERWQAILAAPDAGPVRIGPETAPVAVDIERDRQDRDCQCAACPDVECAGDCERCEDRECEQCRCDEAYGCCGYCPECDDHHGDGTDYRCGECDRCSQCDHHCGD